MALVKVGILGAASYVAGELIKLLLAHPQVEISYLESETFVGQQLHLAHPGLAGLVAFPPCQSYRRETVLKQCDLLFVCKAHTKAMNYVAELLDGRLKVIDLSADFRLNDADVYEQWYGKHSCPQLLEQAVYGLPELYAERIKEAKLVANPGCYPTSVILGIAPLLKAGVVKAETIFVDAYSGLSGAGKTPKPGFNLFLDAYANIKPYKAGVHQHLPEMEQELQKLSEGKVQVTFIPHIVPLERGILSSIALMANQPLDDRKIFEIYERFYAEQPFILCYAPPNLPQIKDVAGTNLCAIGYFYDKRNGLIVVTSVIDNAIKGASGQAVQCMNLMYGWPENEGLGLSVSCQD